MEARLTSVLVNMWAHFLTYGGYSRTAGQGHTRNPLKSFDHIPVSLGGNSVSLSMEVDDAPAWVERDTAGGARVERPVVPGPEEGFQAGWMVDPFGHRWHIMSRLATQ